MFVYLDNSATTRQYEEVTAKMIDCMKEDFGNPSSLHRLGITAEKALREARKAVAEALGCSDSELFFTSGGTESDNMALIGAANARKRRGKRIIITPIEHPAVLETAKRLENLGFEVCMPEIDGNACLKEESLVQLINEDTVLISVMGVNNETGTIQPLREIAEIKTDYNKAHGTDIILHCDAVQSFGKLRLPLAGIDMVSVSAHKIHGPKGTGALYIRKGLNIEPYLTGGGQEKHMRSGTENVPAIAGFGVAAAISAGSLKERNAKLTAVRKYLLEGIRDSIKDTKINGPVEAADTFSAGLACPSVLNVSFAGARGEVLLHTLEQSEIYVSTGSACSSNKKGKSHVLSAMGLTDKQIEGAVRFSFSEFNTVEQMDYVLDRLTEAVAKLRRLGSFR